MLISDVTSQDARFPTTRVSAVRGADPESIEAEFAGSGYGAFKQAVADEVVDHLAPVRERYQELRADEGELERILEAGADKARAIAADTLADVREAMGVGPVSVAQAQRRVSAGQ